MSETSPRLILSDDKRAGVWVFSLLFFIDSMARAFSTGVLSIQAYDLVGSSQKVSMLAGLTSGSVLVLTLLMPMMFGHVRRRWAYTTGALMLVAGSLALGSFTLTGQIAGAIMRNAGASITSVTLQLYILDHIKKADLTRSEPLRLGLSTFAWVVCPYAGVWLYQNYGALAPQLCAAASALTLLAVFWYLRLHDTGVLQTGTMQPFNPIANVKQFISQPRLRLAWLIAFARSGFWMALFTYGPLLMIEGGMGKIAGGEIISLSQLCLLLALLFGYAAKRLGLRMVIALCFVLICVTSILAGGFGTAAPWAAGAFLLLGAAGASGIDAVGGIAYLRAVKFHERQRMTAVYRTYLELSDVLPSLIYMVVLRYADVSIVFVLIGAFAGCVGLLSWRHLPKTM